MAEWKREPLDWMLAKRFSRVIRPGDAVECRANGMSPYQSLQWAVDRGGGESWAVMVGESRVPLGVYGWTDQGAVWSYWQPLLPHDTQKLMYVTPGYVLEMAEKAAKQGLGYLSNYVWEGNRPALAWLRASHCFNLALDAPVTIGNKPFIPFRTKPLPELRRNV